MSCRRASAPHPGPAPSFATPRQSFNRVTAPSYPPIQRQCPSDPKIRPTVRSHPPRTHTQSRCSSNTAPRRVARLLHTARSANSPCSRVPDSRSVCLVPSFIFHLSTTAPCRPSATPPTYIKRHLSTTPSTAPTTPRLTRKSTSLCSSRLPTFHPSRTYYYSPAYSYGHPSSSSSLFNFIHPPPPSIPPPFQLLPPIFCEQFF